MSDHMTAAEYQRTIAQPAREAAPMDDVLFKQQFGIKKAKVKPYTPTEDDLTKQVAQYLDSLMRVKVVKQFTHIANETYTPHHAVKNRNKALGVRPGVPDMMIVFSKGILFLELKREGRSVLSTSQQDWIQALEDLPGVMAVVAKGWKESLEAIETAIKRFN